MEIVKILTEALENLQYVFLLDLVIGFLFLFNILLGSIIGSTTEKFIPKKFFFGVLKAVAVLLIIIGVCYILNVFALTLSVIGITVSADTVSIVEIMGAMVVQGVDLAKEVTEKLKSFRELKFENYDEVVVNDKYVVEPTDQRG